MPPRNPVPGVASIVLKMSYGVDLGLINKFYWAFTGGPMTAAQAAALSASVGTGWGLNIAALCPASVQLELVTVTDLTSATAGAGSTAETTVGTRTGTGLTVVNAAVVQFKIARRYRGGHPRIYLPAGVQSDLATLNSWTGTFQSQVSSAWSSFSTYIGGHLPTGLTNVGQVNVSYFTGFTNHTFPSGRVRPIPNPRATPITDSIFAVSLNPKLGTQRRRAQQSV